MTIPAVLLTFLACLAPLAAGAQAVGPKAFPSFEAKRIKPPQPGEGGKRITVQIDPAAQAARTQTDQAAQAEAETEAAATVPRGRYGWFWDKIDAASDSGRGRLEQALMALQAGQGLSAPRLQLLQEIAKAHAVPILTHTAGTNVSPALVLAVIAVESAGRADAVSSAGAQGLMQLMPDTAARFGVTDALLAPQNIAGGIRYLDWLMGAFEGDPILVLAGYNAGEGAVRAHKGVPPYAETLDYVPKVLAAYQVAKGLCMTPPELISDGCVFRLGQ